MTEQEQEKQDEWENTCPFCESQLYWDIQQCSIDDLPVVYYEYRKQCRRCGVDIEKGIQKFYKLCGEEL